MPSYTRDPHSMDLRHASSRPCVCWNARGIYVADARFSRDQSSRNSSSMSGQRRAEMKSHRVKDYHQILKLTASLDAQLLT